MYDWMYILKYDWVWLLNMIIKYWKIYHLIDCFQLIINCFRIINHDMIIILNNNCIYLTKGDGKQIPSIIP